MGLPIILTLWSVLLIASSYVASEEDSDDTILVLDPLIHLHKPEVTSDSRFYTNNL